MREMFGTRGQEELEKKEPLMSDRGGALAY